MPARKRKKNSRQRGSQTHGWGAKKKHRGSGNRGGMGRAGSGKRADSKKPTMLKLGIVFGKHGFKRLYAKKIKKAIDIGHIEDKYVQLKNEGKIKEVNLFSVINLKDIGANKLLGGGMPSRKYKITAESASSSAVKKIKEKGGEVILPELPEAETPKSSQSVMDNKKEEE